MSKIGKYVRKKQHYHYVEKYVLELREKICIQSIETGCADIHDRHMFLKYNNYLRNLK